MRQVPIAPVKKPYQPPKLIIYGDLTQMTQGMFAAMGMLDGMGTRKT